MNRKTFCLLLTLFLFGCKDTRMEETRNLTPNSPEQREMKRRLQVYEVANVECITLGDQTFLGRRITQSCFGEVPSLHAHAFLTRPVETTQALNPTTVPGAPKVTGIKQCHAAQQNIFLCLDTYRQEGRILAPQHMVALALE